jgi:hypothetical protein
MSILYNKIKIKIARNNDQLLKTIWEPPREMNKKGGKGGCIVKLINLDLLYQYSVFIMFSNWSFNLNFKNYLILGCNQ